MSDELEVLAPNKKIIILNEKEYEISPLKTWQVWEILKEGEKLIDDVNVAFSIKKEIELIDIVKLLSKHGEKISKIISIALNEELKTVGNFSLSDTYTCLKELININQDFFLKEMIPLIKVQEKKQAGQKSHRS